MLESNYNLVILSYKLLITTCFLNILKWNTSGNSGSKKVNIYMGGSGVIE